MNGLEQFLANHSIWDTVILFWIISAAVNAMPEPMPNGSGFYRWIYLFLTTLVGHLHDMIQSRRQQSQPQAAGGAPQGPSTYGGDK